MINIWIYLFHHWARGFRDVKTRGSQKPKRVSTAEGAEQIPNASNCEII